MTSPCFPRPKARHDTGVPLGTPLKVEVTSHFFMLKTCTTPVESPAAIFCVAFLPGGAMRMQWRPMLLICIRSCRLRSSSIAATEVRTPTPSQEHARVRVRCRRASALGLRTALRVQCALRALAPDRRGAAAMCGRPRHPTHPLPLLALADAGPARPAPSGRTRARPNKRPAAQRRASCAHACASGASARPPHCACDHPTGASSACRPPVHPPPLRSALPRPHAAARRPPLPRRHSGFVDPR